MAERGESNTIRTGTEKSAMRILATKYGGGATISYRTVSISLTQPAFMISVTSKVKIYEVNGQEPPPPELATLTISSHWNLEAMVVLELPNSRNTWTVSRRDLEAAIQNATNSNRYS